MEIITNLSSVSQQGFYIYIMDALVKQSIAVSSDSSSSMKITEV